MLLEGEHLEPLSRSISVIVSREHHFTTDTILLAAFSMPKSGDRCVDFGSGCGTIPFLWCSRANPQKVYAVELQDSACSMAKRSVVLNGWEQRIEVCHQDLREFAEQKGLELDVVACNPPYKADGAGLQNPEEAKRLARHECSCTLEEIIAAAARVLRWGGKFFLCQRPERLCDVMLAMRNHGLEPKRLQCVHPREHTEPNLFLIEGRRGGKPGMRIEPPLLLEEGGKLSQRMAEIYGDYKEGHL